MALRALLLKAMLVMLALACGLGVLAVFLSLDVLARLTGTGVVAAVCLAVSLLAASRIERPEQRASGLAILSIVIANFCIAMVAIWGELVLGTSTSDEMVEMAFASAGCGIAAIAMILLGQFGALARGARVGVWLGGATYVALLGAIWTGYPMGSRFAGTAGSIAGIGVVIALCCVGTWRPYRNWRTIGIVSGALATVASIIGVWADLNEGAEVLILLISIAGVVAHAALLALASLAGPFRWLVRGAIACAIGTALLVNALSVVTAGFHASPIGIADVLAKVTAAMAIVTACASLAIGAISILTRRSKADYLPAPASVRDIFVRCPHCGHDQTLPASRAMDGDASPRTPGPSLQSVLSAAPSCERCGLLIAVVVATPRCAGCSYELLNIPAGAPCPECGARRAKGASTQERPDAASGG
jgi:DNA-directed RNA polymerase subunit RPC12/RpoP